MEENQILFAKVENTSIEDYLLLSKMKELDTWGIKLEILAFSYSCNTTLYVYCIVTVRDGDGCLRNLGLLQGTKQNIHVCT